MSFTDWLSIEGVLLGIVVKTLILVLAAAGGCRLCSEPVSDGVFGFANCGVDTTIVFDFPTARLGSH